MAEDERAAGVRRRASGRWSDLRLIQLSRAVRAAAVSDGIAGESAKVAFYFFLALFPLLIALLAFTGLAGGHDAFVWTMHQLRAFLPDSAAEYLAGFVREITHERRPGLLSVGLLLSLWASSNGFDALIKALNVVFAVGEARRWWRRRLVSLLATFTVLCAVTLSAALLSGPRLLGWLGVPRVWTSLRWPLVWLSVAAATWLLYRLVPHHQKAPTGLLLVAGSSLASALWLLATSLFRMYVTHFGRYSVTYGAVGGVMVLLLWLQMTALALLLGAEVAAVRQRELAAARTKPPG